MGSIYAIQCIPTAKPDHGPRPCSRRPNAKRHGERTGHAGHGCCQTRRTLLVRTLLCSLLQSPLERESLLTSIAFFNKTCVAFRFIREDYLRVGEDAFTRNIDTFSCHGYSLLPTQQRDTGRIIALGGIIYSL